VRARTGIALPRWRGGVRLSLLKTRFEALLAFWISGLDSLELPNRKPWLFYFGAPGSRPWAWWTLEQHPPIGADESTDEYLTRTQQWLPGEQQSFTVGRLMAKATAKPAA
jgi:hypothetical protein